MNRRDFMKTTAGTYLLGSLSNRLHADFLPGGTLDPTSVPKYKTQLAIPAVMRKVSTSGTVVPKPRSRAALRLSKVEPY